MRRFGVLLALGLLSAGCGVVDPGERAVFARFGEVTPKCYEEGLYFYNPFTTDMYEIDAKVQALPVPKLEAVSQNLQEIHSDVVVNFSIDGTNCHELLRAVGKDFKERLLVPSVSEVLKASTAHFPVEKLIQERAKLKEEILAGLRAKLGPYHIRVQDVNLTNFRFSDSFSKAVEAKQVEEQNVQREEYVRQQAVKKAEQQVAKAEGEAKANALVRQSLSPELLHFEALRKWNGVLPQVTGAGGVPLIGIGDKR